MNSKIAVIGAGVMGKAIVQHIAQFGFEIFWVEKNPDNFEESIDEIRKHYRKQAKKNRISEDDKDRILRNLSLVRPSGFSDIGNCNFNLHTM